MFLNKYSILIFVMINLLLFTIAGSQENNLNRAYQKIAERIRNEGLQNGRAYSLLEDLVTAAPSRLGGSPGAAAVELTFQMMQDLGLDNIHLESTMVPHWVRGVEEAQIINSSIIGTKQVSICALGGSIGTPAIGITAPVVEVHSFGELQALGESAKGKIIFFNRPMDPTKMDTFSAYGGSVSQRSQGAVEGAKVGALAVLVRSMTTRLDDVPHTGMMTYDPQIQKIPAAAISTKDANLLSELLKNETTVNIHIKLTCRNFSPVASANVIGQITGTEFPNQIILVCGHLDSWDLGVGAHDDGAGCIHALEALRLLKKLGLRPKRTIRAVMFMNEEFGASGGRDYANSDYRKSEKHLAAIESDRGGFMPVGFGVSGSPAAVKKITSWFPYFESLKMKWIRPGGGGADIGPLAQQGTVLLGYVPEDQRYFDVHHSANDVLEAVNERELELGAVAMAIMAYLLAQEGI